MTATPAARRRRRHRARALAVVAALPLLATVLPGLQSSAGTPGASSVTKTKTVTRINLIDDKNAVVDKRTVTLKVDTTNDLHDRQSISVSWSGAHPTDRIVADPNDASAADQEYPMVLLECRGVDSVHVPLSQRVRPETCWTQTSIERYFSSPQLLFPPWRIDRYAKPADRKKVVDAPRPFPSTCFKSGYPEHWLHFASADGRDYPGGPNLGCAGIAPEATAVASTLALPGNTTYAVTDPDGTGQAKFNVWTTLTNASLGCRPGTPCSLVAVPVEGISCDVAAAGLPPADQPQGDDATAAEDACAKTGNDSVLDVSVAGKLWWSASNWRNRITVPLHFAPLPTACDSSGSRQGVYVYGSELMTAAGLQWSSLFCDDPNLFPFTHVQTGEPQARNLLETGNTDAAFSAFAPDGGYTTPVVSAPVAMTGFAIGFSVDDANGHEVTKLRLTPRLLAKLLTESYPAVLDVAKGWAQEPTKSGYPAMANNPLNIAADPEFQALNPGIAHDVANTFGAATLFTLSSESDVIRALTAYINADTEARAWLNGAPDPWGMVVNPHYKGIHLPVDSWPLLDTYEPRSIYNDNNVCLEENPVPYLPLVAQPTNRLANISLNLQYGISQSQVVCQGAAGSNPKLVAVGRETIGYRFLIGVTTLADAKRYGINTAQLQTRVDGSAPYKFDDASGRSFVAPDDKSLAVAAAALVPDATSGVWRLPYNQIIGGDGSATAYPGAMLVSAAIPTVGLPRQEARDYAQLLRFAATRGQTPGGGAGDLPPGYLPMTSANGLGSEARYTAIAAQYVAAQTGTVPSLTDPRALPGSSNVPPAPGTGPGGTTGGSTGSSGGTSTGSGRATTGLVPDGAGTGVTTGGSSGASGGTPPVIATSPTSASTAGAAGVVLPILLLIGLGAGLAAPTLTRVARRSG